MAGLFTVLLIRHASHNLLQQPKPSILSFIAAFVQAENCTEYCSVLLDSICTCCVRLHYCIVIEITHALSETNDTKM